MPTHEVPLPFVLEAEPEDKKAGPRRRGRAPKRTQRDLVGSSAAVKESRAKKPTLPPAKPEKDEGSQSEGEQKRPQKNPPDRPESPQEREQVKERPGIFEKKTRKFLAEMGPLALSSSAVDEFVRIGGLYRDQVLDDLHAYSRHAGRKKVEENDVRLLFKRQKLHRNQNINQLIRSQLPGGLALTPGELAEELLPIARADNAVYPPQ